MATSPSLEIIGSIEVQRRWGFAFPRSAGEPPAHWLTLWRLDLAPSAFEPRWLLATNVATLYSFLLPLDEAKTPDAFEALFRLRLGFALVDANELLAWRNAPINFGFRQLRSATGSMNEMKFLLKVGLEESGPDPAFAWEDQLNRTPCGALDMQFPVEAFAERCASQP